MVEQIAAIHGVDLQATDLERIGDGLRHLDASSNSGPTRSTGPNAAQSRRSSDWWSALREQQPEQCPSVTLVHGDAKPGNFAFQDGEVTAVFDWEMATIGDPLTDIGWAELLWTIPGSFTTLPGALSVDEFVARWEELTGIDGEASTLVPSAPEAQDGDDQSGAAPISSTWARVTTCASWSMPMRFTRSRCSLLRSWVSTSRFRLARCCREKSAGSNSRRHSDS